MATGILYRAPEGWEIHAYDVVQVKSERGWEDYASIRDVSDAIFGTQCVRGMPEKYRIQRSRVTMFPAS
jgi:hypothetical protein